ncbi:MAG: serine/threonine-protein kinase [Polyangiaceae bacterium]
MELRSGARVDRYTLVVPLGEGGQACVWKAIDPMDGGAVRALKIFQLRGAGEQQSARARREAESLAGAHHPGIVPCRAHVEIHEHGLIILVFDYARGLSLADAMTDRRMTPELRWSALHQVAGALAYVHGRNILHRDVKPDNVLVTEAFWRTPDEPGTLKLLDFGIAAPAGNPKPLTREGGVVGTAPYLPPELLEPSQFETGNDFHRDVFAFGVLAWEVLFGQHPTVLPISSSRTAFAGAYLAARAGKRPWPPEPPEPSQAPGVEVVRACLSLSARQRPESAIGVFDALRSGVLSGRPRTSEPVISGAPARPSRTEIHVPPGTETDNHGRGSTVPFSGRPSFGAPVSMPSGYAKSVRDPRVSAPPYSGPSVVSQRVSGVPSGGRGDVSEPRGSSFGWGVVLGILAAVVLLVGVLAGVVYFSNTGKAVEPAALPFPGLGLPAQTPPASQPVSPDPESPVTQEPARACCTDDKGTCRSRRPCQLPPCAGMLDDGPWRLRVVGGYLKAGGGVTEIQRTWRSSKICIKNTRTGQEQCALSDTMWTKGSDSKHRVLVTTQDLTDGNLEVRLVGGPGEWQSPLRAIGALDGYTRTALCDPVALHLGQRNPDLGRISVHLDDP